MSKIKLGNFIVHILFVVFFATLIGVFIPWSTKAQSTSQEQIRLNVVGGLSALNQYTRHEKPFWSQRLRELTKGLVSAEIQPFDQAGIRGQEMLRLIQLGVIPFGTTLLPLAAANDPVLGAPDLAGLSLDMDTLRTVVKSFRPYLKQMLRERYGIEALAVYVYPAQVIFCSKPLLGLGDLRSRRIRTSNVSQSVLIEALGAVPVQLPFAGLKDVVKSGRVECAVTGTMSGNTIGLHEVTTHIYPMAINWGISVFGANAASWEALPGDIKVLLQKELEKLEQAIWEESDRETKEGVMCNIGDPSCGGGTKGRMIEVLSTLADKSLIKEVLADTVIPHWIESCGRDCADIWNQTIGPHVGITVQNR